MNSPKIFIVAFSIGDFDRTEVESLEKRMGGTRIVDHLRDQGIDVDTRELDIYTIDEYMELLNNEEYPSGQWVEWFYGHRSYIHWDTVDVKRLLHKYYEPSTVGEMGITSITAAREAVKTLILERLGTDSESVLMGILDISMYQKEGVITLYNNDTGTYVEPGNKEDFEMLLNSLEENKED